MSKDDRGGGREVIIICIRRLYSVYIVCLMLRYIVANVDDGDDVYPGIKKKKKNSCVLQNIEYQSLKHKNQKSTQPHKCLI